MMIYALIIEAHSDDDRLIGLYSSLDAAKAAYDRYLDRHYYPFYRVEARELDGEAFENGDPWHDPVVVYERHSVEHDDESE